MAKDKPSRQKIAPVHPWRPLGALFLVLVVLAAAMIGLRAWTPKLGLDLQGGTTITLTAANTTGDGSVDQASLEQARTILQQRVDSLGVGESEVNTAGNNQITISVPNVSEDRLLDMVGQTALLNFRVVHYAEPVGMPTEDPGQPDAEVQPGAGEAPAPDGAEEPAPDGAEAPAPEGNDLPTAPAVDPSSAGEGMEPSPYPTAPGEGVGPVEAMAWTPTEQDFANFAAYSCDQDVNDVSDQPLMTCDREGTAKYLLGPTVVSGNQVTDASAGIPQGQLQWVVSLEFDGEGAERFAEATTMLSQGQPSSQFAIVLDGLVVSAPQVNEPIPNGQAQIDGGAAGFAEEDAHQLASVLKYGALPLSFSVDSVDTVSPVLGGEQLRGALWAGALGLLLVAIFAVIMYRTLAWVAMASIALAGVMTYALLVLLGQALGVALNLPGIAGAIVGIAVTADSYIIFFERIKDEVRSGRTLRSAVEAGWLRARGTILISDGVQLLSAVVLFFLSIGAVRGFAFILGLTTIIDLLITLWFTKPIMTVMMRTRFFSEGRRGSGLEPSAIGVKELPRLRRRVRSAPAAAGSRAGASTTGTETRGEEA